MRRGWTWWVPVALVLAGCAGNPPVTPDVADDEPRPLGPVEISDRHGGIEGHVLDVSLLPVANATVTLREPHGAGDGLDATATADDGRFVFHLVEPGTYRVTATQDGFANATQVAVVAAGQATKVSLSLDDVASDEPYIDLKIQAGLINCAFAVVVVSGVCLPQYTQPVFGPYNIALFYDIPVGHTKTVAETDWDERSQVMRNWFFHDETRDTNFEGDWMGDAIGPPILRKEFTPGEVPSSFAPIQSGGHPFPPADQNFTFLSVTYYDGSYQQEINGTAWAVCQHNPIVGYCTGAGLGLGVRFTQYVSVFVHQVPPSVAQYSAVPDR